MHHPLPLAALALTIGTILATFVFPEPITAYNTQVSLASPATTSAAAVEPHPLVTPVTEQTLTTSPTVPTPSNTIEALLEPPQSTADLRTEAATIRLVPFFSQFADITDPAWKKVACGVASLAMLVNYYQPKATNADEILRAGIAADAYTEQGWSHAGLIGLAAPYGLTGSSHSLAHETPADAFATLKNVVAEGPVMASVHYTFEPTNPIPHLVVITHIADGYVYYNDPAEARGNGFITAEKFQNAWKQRYIKIRPAV
jgi:hypothetical protein